jgi:hypothetical protein
MRIRNLFLAVLGLALAAGAADGLQAQDNPNPQLQLGGTYKVSNVTPSEDGTVNLDFSATITNQGDRDVSGQILLRDYSNNETVWGRFGNNTISAGGNVTVSGNVTVPKAIYSSWSGGSSPSVYIYAEDSQGDVTMVNISLSRVATPPPGK